MTNTNGGRIEGKTALITGGASGIGLATAKRFIAQGANVMITDLDDVGGAKARRGLGARARFAAHDVTDEARWDEVVDETVENFGRLDILVNSAGVFLFGTIEDTSVALFRKTIAINLEGTFLGCRSAVKAMRDHGGSIINLSSISGLVGFADAVAYDASKGGVRLLTKSVALHCAREKYAIRCNSVHPGGIATPMVSRWFETHSDPGAEELSWVSGCPLGRLGQADEVASVILFLASDESSFVTGSEYVIDGGSTAQ